LVNKNKALTTFQVFSSGLLLKNNSNPEIAVQEILGRRNEMLRGETTYRLGNPFNGKIV